jgi:hypothetical protein
LHTPRPPLDCPAVPTPISRVIAPMASFSQSRTCGPITIWRRNDQLVKRDKHEVPTVNEASPTLHSHLLTARSSPLFGSREFRHAEEGGKAHGPKRLFDAAPSAAPVAEERHLPFFGGVGENEWRLRDDVRHKRCDEQQRVRIERHAEQLQVCRVILEARKVQLARASEGSDRSEIS